MTINELEKLLDLYLRYPMSENVMQKKYPSLTENFSANFIAWDEDDRTAFVAKAILDFFDQSNVIIEKAQALEKLEGVIANVRLDYKKNLAEKNQRLNGLKEAIAGVQGNWKDILISNTLVSVTPEILSLRAKGVKYKSDKRLQTPITRNKDRFKEKQTPYSYAVMGSTFASNRSCALDSSFKSGNPNKGLKTDYIYDAAFTRLIYDTNGNVSGLAMGVADGCGHKTMKYDPLARTSYFALKHFLRLASVYADADAFTKDIPQLLQITKAYVKRKTPNLESTTLTAACAFLQADGTYRVVGVSIGDTSLHAFNPVSKQFLTIASIRTKTSGFTASFPFYQPNEVEIFDIQLPENIILLGMSDGATDALPHKIVKKRYGPEIIFNEADLILEKLELAQADTLEMAVNNLTTQVINATEMKRQEIKDNIDKKIYTVDCLGDDYTLLGIQLPDTAKRQSLQIQVPARPVLLVPTISDNSVKKLPKVSPPTPPKPVESAKLTISRKSLAQPEEQPLPLSMPHVNYAPYVPLPKTTNKKSMSMGKILGIVSLFALSSILLTIGLGLVFTGAFSPIGLLVKWAGISIALTGTKLLAVDMGIMAAIIGLGIGGVLLGRTVLRSLFCNTEEPRNIKYDDYTWLDEYLNSENSLQSIPVRPPVIQPPPEKTNWDEYKVTTPVNDINTPVTLSPHSPPL